MVQAADQVLNFFFCALRLLLFYCTGFFFFFFWVNLFFFGSSFIPTTFFFRVGVCATWKVMGEVSWKAQEKKTSSLLTPTNVVVCFVFIFPYLVFFFPYLKFSHLCPGSSSAEPDSNTDFQVIPQISQAVFSQRDRHCLYCLCSHQSAFVTLTGKNVSISTLFSQICNSNFTILPQTWRLQNSWLHENKFMDSRNKGTVPTNQTDFKNSQDEWHVPSKNILTASYRSRLTRHYWLESAIQGITDWLIN